VQTIDLHVDYWGVVSPATGTMNPPRLPLQDRPSGIVNGANILRAVGSGSKRPKVARVIPSEFMSAFKQEVSGSDLTKIALIEHLKKQYVALDFPSTLHVLTYPQVP
jgi:chromatin assembly factor 1 subunit A